MNAIEVTGLRKSYKHKGKMVNAVDGIDFEIKEGEIFGLLGENGAGKSTTINMLSGILTKDSGEIRFFGRNIDERKNWEEIRNSMNVSSAYFGLSGNMTIYENLVIYAKLFGVKDYKARIEHLLEQFGLTQLREKKANTLSSGENTRLNLCKGFINKPKLMLLDECTVGLDPNVAEKTRQYIKQYQKENNATILFTSHYMYEVEQLCDRIAFIQDGKIIKVDTADNIKNIIKKQTVEMKFIKDNPEIKKMLEERNFNILYMQDNRVMFEVVDEGDKLYRLMSSLFKRGHFIEDLRINKPTLQDIFIKVTSKKKNEEDK